MTLAQLEDVKPSTDSLWEGFTYATPRNHDRQTHGTGIAVIAEAIHRPGMPWQREVWDVAGEVDSFGNLVYEIILVTVPRQSGKTTLFGPVQIHRALTLPSCKTFYTAQTGQAARARFNDLYNLIDGSALKSRVLRRRSAGDEALIWPTGSQNKIFAPVESALHGETPPLVGMDEIWEFDELLGDALLEGAIIPAQITLAGKRQVWLMSTAGTAESVFMKKWVERGRKNEIARAEGKAVPYPKLAYFEASLRPGDDPYDPAAIARFHPAVGHTQTVDDLLAIATGGGENGEGVSRATWLRAFCNVWTETSEPLIPVEAWDAMGNSTIGALRSEIAVSWEVAPDNDMGAILASWRVDGVPHTRILHAAPGTQWMEDLLVRIHDEWNPRAFGADDGGPTRRISDRLRLRLGAEAVETLGPKDFGVACDTWITSARDHGELVHDGSKTLRAGIAHSVLVRRGEMTRFSRAEATGPQACAVIASAAALWLWDHTEEAQPLVTGYMS